MLRPRTRRRRGESGQVLLMALAFIALFAAASVAVLTYASRTQSQKQHSEVTAQTDSLAEGGADFALADNNRGDSSCDSGNSGTLTMQSGDKVNYSTVKCATVTAGSSSLASNCTLCLLGTADNTLYANKAPVTVTGTVAINGGASLNTGSPLTSLQVGSTPPFIGMVRPSTCTTVPDPNGCNPTATAISAISDPLDCGPVRSCLPPPVRTETPLSVRLTGTTSRAIDPGVYTSLDAAGSGTLTLHSGVYVITGSLTSSGGGSIVSDVSNADPNMRGVLIYLTCADNQGNQRACNPGESGATVALTGTGSFTAAALPPGSGSPYSGVVLYADRNNSDPSSNTPLISLQGNGNSLSGSIYAKSATLAIGGNGSANISGRLIAKSFNMQVSGQVGTGVSLTGVDGGLNKCSTADANVSGTSGSNTSQGRAVVQWGCAAGIVAFTYGGTAVSQAPAFTSANSTTFTVGSAGSFQATATGFPTPTFSEAGALPSGVTLNSTGLLSGTPAAGTARTYTLTITATNGVSPDATQNFTLTVVNQANQAPAITSGASTTFTVGSAGSFQATATGSPAPTFTEVGALPSGVTLSTSGLLSGTPAAATGGTYPFTITAANGVSPNATQSFTLTIHQAPAVTSANSATFTVGTPGSFQMTATGFPASTFSETGALPTGVALNSSGLLTGTPAAATRGTYPLTITATNGVSPNAMQTFTLTVQNPFAGIDWANATRSGAGTVVCNYTNIQAVTCTATGAGNGWNFAANVRLMDTSQNTVTNSTGSPIAVTQTVTGTGSTTTSGSMSIAPGLSTTPGQYQFTTNGNHTATITASITVNSVTYTVTCTVST